MSIPYYVVYEYVDKQHHSFGCRFTQIFSDEKSFNGRDRTKETGLKILAKGVSADEAKKLYQEIPLQFLMLSCLNQATKNGDFDYELYDKRVQALIKAMANRFEESKVPFDPKTMLVSQEQVVAMLLSLNHRGLYLQAIQKAVDPRTGKYNHDAYLYSLKQTTLTSIQTIFLLGSLRK